MPVASQPRSAQTGVDAPPAEIAILWLIAGLSCDGDSIAMTAATPPSLEDIVARAARAESPAADRLSGAEPSQA
jgi:hypothetical protein